MMKTDVLPNADVVKTLEGYVPVYIDVDLEENNAFAADREITGLPTFVLFDADGDEAARMVGARPTPETFLEDLKTLGGELASLREFKKQLAAIDAKLATAPNNPAVLKAKGDLLTDNGRMEEGLKVYERIPPLDPANKTGVTADLTFFRIIEGIDSEEKLAEGDKALQKFQKDFPDSRRVEDVFFLRAAIALQQKNTEAAKALLETVREKFPQGRFKSRADTLLEMIAEDEQQAAEPPMQ
jgi:tetratricopeptide (TPR) repeat protein